MEQTNLIGSLTPGTVLPDIAPEPITRERILDYAGASGDFNPMHVDEVTNVTSGLGGVFAHGMLGTGFLGRVVTDHLGDIPLTSLSVRCTKIVRPGSVLSCGGTILQRAVEGQTARVLFGLRAVDEEGDVTHEGTATIGLPLQTLAQFTADSLDESSPLVRWRAIG